MSIKVRGFLQDVGGASRVTKLREENFAKGSPIPDPRDPIREMADLLHPTHMTFRVTDIRDILCTHGHYDHLGAAKALRELSGGKIYLPAADRSYANGTEDLTWAKEIGTVYYEAFEPDVLLHPGDTVCRGNTKIVCRDAAGHTPGTMAFFFDVTDGKQTLRAGMHGGVGLKSIKKAFLEQNPDVKENWDEEFGDRENQIVFIGKGYNQEEIKKALESCLDEKAIA